MAWFTPLLLPLSLCYALVMWLRKLAYRSGVIAIYRSPVPVIVVGNLTVGGTGKTPLVIFLAEQLAAAGFSPGIISRGYGGESATYPLMVTATTPAQQSGDEAALIARETGVPVAVGANRKASIELLLDQHQVDIIVSDDGLQHLALARDIEVCVSDASRTSDNTFLLPAGPYRESVARLKTVDFVVKNGAENNQSNFSMQLQPGTPRPVIEGLGEPFDSSDGVHAVAAIGHPERFFATCESLGWRIDRHVFPDHHAYARDDIEFDDHKPVVMTAKDAVKCTEIADHRHWVLPVSAKLGDSFFPQLLTLLKHK